MCTGMRLCVHVYRYGTVCSTHVHASIGMGLCVHVYRYGTVCTCVQVWDCVCSIHVKANAVYENLYMC